MKKSVLGLIAIGVLIAAPAMAADIGLPLKAPPLPPAPVASWTGCYVNAGAGYGMYSQNHQLTELGVPLGVNHTNGGEGWLGLVGGGCDYQFSTGSLGSWVVGAFADYDFMDLHGDFTEANSLVGSEKESGAWAVGGRIGYLVTPAILTYFNGGWTGARFDGVNFVESFNGQPSGTVLGANTFSGWFIGGGTEIAVQAWPGLYWRNEYRYSGYGAANVPAGPIIAEQETKHVQTITTSLVWKLPAPAGVPAYKAAPSPPLPAVSTWTGCYVNAGAGYGMYSQNHQLTELGVPFSVNQTNGGEGWLGVAGGGCDYQFSTGQLGNWVVGAFADYDFMDLHGDFTEANFGFGGSETESGAWAVGGRIGYLVTPAILTYLNGGWTDAHFNSVNIVEFNGAPSGEFLPANTFSGWFIGGGTEIAVQAWPGLYWRNEYRYSGYGAADLAYSGSGGVEVEHETKHVQTITSSLVWKFNWGH